MEAPEQQRQVRETIQQLSKRYHLNPKTVSKWKKRNFTTDAAMGPKKPRSTVLSLEEEAAIIT